MLKTLRVLVGCFIGLMAGCQSMPKEMALDSKVSSAQRAGLVVGALLDTDRGAFGTWLEFRDTRTGQTYGWAVQDYYSAWLPAGEYEVFKLGARGGAMGAFTNPLRFSVKQGDINYLGEMLYDCPQEARPSALYGVIRCGFLALGSCSVPSPNASVCVVDRQDQAIRSFLRKNPKYTDMPVRSSLMSAR